MVFSRYVRVIRKAGSSLRQNLFESEVKPESLCKTANFNVCSINEYSSNALDAGKSRTSKFTSDSAVSFTKQIESRNTSEYLPFAGEFHKIDDELDEDDENLAIEDLERVRGLPNALETCSEDLSHVTPFILPTFNFSAYADSSETIKELAKLGVELWKIEKKEKPMKIILRRSFDEMKEHIRFIADCGVPANEIGNFITKNPCIFTQSIDDLTTRVRYMRAHKFDRDMIARIVTKNPFWLMFTTKKIDERLGHFQREFQLAGKDVRAIATKQPNVVTAKMRKLVENTFALREEMGFDKNEVKTLVVDKPRILIKSRTKIVGIFDYVHNTMKIPHEILCRQSFILFSGLERIRNRHKYLEMLGKNQYDPMKPLYVSPNTLITGSDADFCRNVAITTIETYNLYLKSL